MRRPRGADLRRPRREFGAGRDGLGGRAAGEDPDQSASRPTEPDNWTQRASCATSPTWATCRSTCCSSTPARSCASRSRTCTGTPTIASPGTSVSTCTGIVEPGGGDQVNAAAQAGCRLRRAPARHRGAVPVAAAVLPDPVRDRAEDRFSNYADRDAAVRSRCCTGPASSSCRCKLNLGNFAFLVEDNLYWRAYLNSIKVAAISTVLVPADRLSDGVRDRAQRSVDAATSCCCW